MADKETIKTLERIITIPAKVEYPSIRMILDSGLLVKGDRIILQLTVIDSKDKEKFNESNKITLKEYPDDLEVIGRACLDLTETYKTIIVEEEVQSIKGK